MSLRTCRICKPTHDSDTRENGSSTNNATEATHCKNPDVDLRVLGGIAGLAGVVLLAYIWQKGEAGPWLLFGLAARYYGWVPFLSVFGFTLLLEWKQGLDERIKQAQN